MLPDPGRLSYVAILAFVLVGSLWLEVALRTRVLARWRRLLLTMVIPIALFVCWDAYAIASGHWTFDVERILGIEVVAGVPIDEVLFFVCIPLASVLTLEAVRSVKNRPTTSWRVGDEESS